MSDPVAVGHLFVVSAPSGGGKTSLVRKLLAQTPHLVVSVSHTTRPRREGEVDGEAYHFVDDATFSGMANQHAFIEHATVFDHQYGTAHEVVDAQLAAGVDVLLEIDWQGARSIRAAAPDAITVFVLPPSIEELERRLRGRGDSQENVARRMRDAVSEMSHYGEYDYLVINDDFDKALSRLSAIVTAARQRRSVQAARHAAMIAALVESQREN